MIDLAMLAKTVAAVQGAAASAASLGLSRPATESVSREIAVSEESADGRLVRLFDELVTLDLIRNASRSLFVTGHYARSVEEAFKSIDNAVRAQSKLRDFGSSLMKTTFSPNKPKLKLNPMSTDSEVDEQLGYMEIFAGSMTGIRNPRAHQNELEDDPVVALEMLVLANHLGRRLQSAERPRGRPRKRKK